MNVEELQKVEDVSNPLLFPTKSLETKDKSMPAKMSNFKAWFAIVKCYMAISILITPRSFVNGGYLMSPFALIIVTCIESFSSWRLVRVA